MTTDTTALVRVPVVAVTTVDDVQPESRLSTWVIRYWQEEVEGGPEATVAAKRRDLQLFLDYFGRTLRSDHLDDWTRSISRGFVRWLETDANGGTGYPMGPGPGGIV